MTEIFRENGLSIQTFTSAAALIGAGGTRNDDFTLDPPGRFLGAVGTPDANGFQIECVISTIAGGTIAYGDSVTAIRVHLSNSSAGGLTTRTHLIAFIGV